MRAKRRRFPRAIGAQQSDLLALVDCEADIPQRAQAAVLDDEMIDFEQAHPAAPLAPR